MAIRGCEAAKAKGAAETVEGEGPRLPVEYDVLELSTPAADKVPP